MEDKKEIVGWVVFRLIDGSGRVFPLQEDGLYFPPRFGVDIVDGELSMWEREEDPDSYHYGDGGEFYEKHEPARYGEEIDFPFDRYVLFPDGSSDYCIAIAFFKTRSEADLYAGD